MFNMKVKIWSFRLCSVDFVFIVEYEKLTCAVRFICIKMLNAWALKRRFAHYFTKLLPVNLEGLVKSYIICHLDFTLMLLKCCLSGNIFKQIWTLTDLFSI